jgi:uncharacterized protein YwqG
MIYNLNVALSAELEQFRDKIEATIKPFIQIIPQYDTDLTRWQSKLGGLPYLPKSCQYPTDDNGNYLFLLAQINCAEVPDLDDFPERGILQFYIADNDSLGANWDNPTQQTKFRVLYFSDILKTEDNLITDFSFLPQPDYLPINTNTSCSLQFQKQIAPVAIGDYEFETLLGDHFFAQFGDKKEVIWEEYAEKFSLAGHKIGGYADFTQEDPRLRLNQNEQYYLLLQLDSDDSVDMMWGDAGIGNFFIKPADLAKRDFSKVLYNWDCH